MQASELDFNVVIASPDAMRVVGKLGQLLGRRGLMPNPKVGTVSADVAGAVRNAKAGQVRYRADKGGTVHCVIGNVSFEVEALKQNLMALVADLQRLKPASANRRLPAASFRFLDDGTGRARRSVDVARRPKRTRRNGFVSVRDDRASGRHRRP